MPHYIETGSQYQESDSGSGDGTRSTGRAGAVPTLSLTQRRLAQLMPRCGQEQAELEGGRYWL